MEKIRIKRANDYVIAERSVILDKDLSLAAVGLYVKLLCIPNGRDMFDFVKDDFETGVALQELIGKGYATPD